MAILKIIACAVVVVYLIAVILLYALQTKLIFYPGKLHPDHRFISPGEEISLTAKDGEIINGLFFQNRLPDVILYFHGNAGDLSGWQHVADDFTNLGYNFFILDYRGYGKSSGTISEKGFYLDAQAAYDFLVQKGFAPGNIIIYGRSIGSGVAIDLASRNACRGVVLEAPFSSLGALANEKIPFFFPSLYLRFRFNNADKINRVKSPVILLHGSDDTLIPPSHSEELFGRFIGKKKLILVENGSHNDLHSFMQYEVFLRGDLLTFFE